MLRTWKIRLALAAILAVFAVTAVWMVLVPRSAAPREPLPDLVWLAPGSFQYRAGGDFTRGGRPATAPIVAVIAPALAVMRHQVTVGEYRRCVDAGVSGRR